MEVPRLRTIEPTSGWVRASKWFPTWENPHFIHFPDINPAPMLTNRINHPHHGVSSAMG
jgi:hypothetical protein